MISASSLHRVFACPPSASLPVKIRRGNKDANLGTAAHRFLENVVNVGRAPALAKITDDAVLRLCERINTEWLKPENYAAEVAFLWERETGKVTVLGKSIDRAYGQVEGCIPGTADIIAYNPAERHGYVGDYKTGWDPEARIQPAKENDQLLFLALCVARHYDLDTVDVEIIRTAKLDDDGNPYRDTARFEAFDLDTFEQRLKQGWDDAAAALEGGTFTLGDHCHGCNSITACPAQTNQLLALANKTSVLELTPQNHADVRQRISFVEGLLEEARRQLNALSDVEPLPLPNGMVYGPKPMEHVLGDRARDYVAKQYGEEVARACTEIAVKSSKDRIKDELKKRGHWTTTKEWRWIEEQLRLAGCFRETITHRPYRPGKATEE